MGGTTPRYGLPYPTGTDRVADGDNAIQALAERAEGVLGGWTDIGGNCYFGFTLGGTPLQRYRRDGNTVFVEAGGTIAVVGAISLGMYLPLPMYRAGAFMRAAGTWAMLKVGISRYSGVIVIDGNNQAMMLTGNSPKFNDNVYPAAWAAGDEISMDFRYETDAALGAQVIPPPAPGAKPAPDMGPVPTPPGPEPEPQ